MKFFILSILILFGCSEAEFSDSKKSSTAPVVEENLETLPSKVEIPKPSPSPKSSQQELSQRCWFAVSGVWMGVTDGNFAGIFPRVIGDGNIKHKTRFDSWGGVFLEARDKPYKYQDSGGEIDAAVEWTFDTIAIAPGMEVEIRDEKDVLIFQGKGPIVGQSTFYANAETPYRDKLLANKDIPSWMRDIAESNEIKEIDLHSQLIGLAPGDAQSVLVKKIPGSVCDQAF